MSNGQIDELLKAYRVNDKEKFDLYSDKLDKNRFTALTQTMDQMLLNEKIVKRYGFYHYILQLLLILVTSSIPILSYISTSKSLIIVIGVIDTILVSLTNLFKFKEHRHIFQQMNQKLIQEYSWYGTGRGPYTNLLPGTALDLFLDRTEKTKNDGFEFSIALENSVTTPTTKTTQQ